MIICVLTVSAVRSGACIGALTALKFRRDSVSLDELGIDAVNEWTLQLLRVRHLGPAERLHALLVLLVSRLGLRCSDSFQLPFKLTHDRFGELIEPRVTDSLAVQMAPGRPCGDVLGDVVMSRNHDFVERSPLSF